MPNLDMKAVFEALLPPGSLWQPAPAAGFDQFLNALGENANGIYERLYDLGFIRDPRKTPILSDLEKELGVFSDDRLTETVRRQQLAAVKYAKPGTASDSDLQTILRNAGFDVYVRRNHPVVDPADLLLDQYLLEAGEIDAFAGEPNAIAGLGGGELLVNGPIVLTSVNYESEANGADMFAGEPGAVAGRFSETTYTPITYEIPANSDYWPYIFFIAGQPWGHLNDWNMEYATVGQWIASPNAISRKNIDVAYINSGIRSFELVAYYADYSSGISGALTYAINMLDMPILNSVDVSGYFWGSGASSSIAPSIEYYDPILETWVLGAAGISSISKQSFSFTSINGISGIRLSGDNSIFPLFGTEPLSCFFDDILIETKNITRAQIPSEREAEFKRLVLKYKPLDTWAGLILDYV